MIRLLAVAAALSAAGCIVPASAPGIVPPHHVRLAAVETFEVDPPDQRHDRVVVRSAPRASITAPPTPPEETVLTVTPWQTEPSYVTCVDPWGRPFVRRRGRHRGFVYDSRPQRVCDDRGYYRPRRTRRRAYRAGYRRGVRDGRRGRRYGYRDGYRRRDGFRRGGRRDRYRRYDRRRW